MDNVALAGTAAELAIELDAAEDHLEIGCDATGTLAIAVRIEAAAEALGEIELAVRARLLKADMSERKGHPAATVQMLWEVNRWAAEHSCRPLLARSHLLLARNYYNLGDMAVCLDHAVCAVETLDPAAPSHTRAYHLMKLADALKWNGSMAAARERYRQAERLATADGPVVLLMMVLNNLAYGEYGAGEPQRSWAAIERLLSVAATHGKMLNPAKTDTIARTQIALGRYAEAAETIQTGLRNYHASGYELTSSYAEQLLTLAVAERFLGSTDQAQATLDRCLAICAEHGHAGIAVRVHQEQAELHAAAGDFPAALEAHKSFYVENEKLRSRQREAQAGTRQAMFETTEARQDAELFREQARRDPLTGLHNRRFVDEHLPALITTAIATGSPLTIAMIDLDHFKRINDTHSHQVGDNVLVIVANLLFTDLTTVAETGFVARMGGEEFLMVLPDTTLTDATRHLDHLRATIGSHAWQPVTGDLPVTVSIGATATGTDRHATQSTLLAGADRNLYAAKHAGRDRVVTQSPAAQRRRYRDTRPA